VNPLCRANRYGYAALLTQSLDTLPGSAGPLQVAHIPTPRDYDGIVPQRCVCSPHSPNVIYLTTGVYHDNQPDPLADAALRGLLLSRLNQPRWPAFIPALTRGLYWPIPTGFSALFVCPSHYFDLLGQRHSHLRQCVRALLDALTLRGSAPDDDLLDAIDLLRRLNQTGRRWPTWPARFLSWTRPWSMRQKIS
jgi:hypothetical protein